jgi:hypothetical protein
LNPSNPRLAYKYRSGDANTLLRDLESLKLSRFYAALRSELNDPFEGRFDRGAFDTQFDVVKQLLEVAKPGSGSLLEDVALAAENLLSFVDRCGILSLSHDPLNELIWSHYGGSHQGFCIGYDLAKLVEFEKVQFHCIDVIYEASSPVISVNDLISTDSLLPLLQKFLGTKSLPWQYEREVRVITTVAGLHEYDFRAVKAIYFGLRASEETKSKIMEALAGRGVRYMQVTSPEHAYQLESAEIPDAFQDARPYMWRLAPIVEGAISVNYLKPEQKRHAHYLARAAEIVRREPYCQEIQLVDFSVSRSTSERPVIFVQYQRAENRWENHYLTLLEIDEQYERLGVEDKDV